MEERICYDHVPIMMVMMMTTPTIMTNTMMILMMVMVMMTMSTMLLLCIATSRNFHESQGERQLQGNEAKRLYFAIVIIES